MAMEALLNTILSASSTNGIGKAAGLSGDQTRSVLTAALPQLLSGALSQSNNSSTASAFSGALTQHAASNTADLGAFLSGVDMKDGEKIVGHLLGSNSDAVVSSIAGSSGVGKADVRKVLAVSAPLLMSLLGKEVQQQGNSNSSAGIAGVMGSLLGGSGAAGLLGGMLGGGAGAAGGGNAGGIGSLLTGLLK